jgi:hypothetical protein
VCEGRRDRIFLEETLRTMTNAQNTIIKTFEEPKLLEKAIMYGEKAPVMICEGKGFPGNTKVAVRLSCKFMRYMRFSMGVVGDSDRGSVYDETTTYLESYLGTPCKVHAMRPQIARFDADQKATITLDSKISVTIWAFEIPESLEIRICEKLRSNHRELTDCCGEREILNRAVEVLGTDEDGVIRRSVPLFHDAKWFNNLCGKARTCM